MTAFLFTVCWLALFATALIGIGGAAIGAGYHPENTQRYFLIALSPILPAFVLLMAMPRVLGTGLRLLVDICAAVFGITLAGFAGLRILKDPGDAVLWLPPLVLGLGVLGLCVQSARGEIG